MFDDLQKKAVEYYKSSPVAKATSSVPGTKFGSPSAAGVATPMPEAVQSLEAELEVCTYDIHRRTASPLSRMCVFVMLFFRSQKVTSYVVAVLSSRHGPDCSNWPI